MICSVFFVCLMSLFFVHIKVALLEVFSSSRTWLSRHFFWIRLWLLQSNGSTSEGDLDHMTVTQVRSEGNSKWYMEMRWFLNIPGHDVRCFSFNATFASAEPYHFNILETWDLFEYAQLVDDSMICFFVEINVYMYKLYIFQMRWSSGQFVFSSLVLGMMCVFPRAPSDVRTSPHSQYNGVETSKVWFWIYQFFD